MYPYQSFARDDSSYYLSPSLASGDGDSVNNDIALTANDVALVLIVNKDTYTDILSAALNGAIPTFPEDWMQVIYPLIKAGKMVLCDSVADCIDNSQAVSLAMQRFMNRYASGDNTYNTTNYALSPAEIEGQLLPAGYTCDNDHFMGMARYIVQSLNYAVVEVLQSVELATTPIEALARFMDNVPVLELLGIFVEAFSLAQDNLYTVYSAAYTQAVEDALCCELFCLFSDECVVSVELIENAYRNVWEGTLPPVTEDLNEFMTFLVNNVASLASISVVAVCHLMVIELVKHAAQFGNIFGLRTLEALIAIGSDEIDTSWSACDPCNLIPYTGFFDWHNHAPEEYEGITVSFIWGGYSPGNGLYTLQNPDGSGNNYYGLQYQIILDNPVNIDQMVEQLGGVMAGSITLRRMWLYDSSDNLIRYISSGTALGIPTITWNETGVWTGVKRIILLWKVFNSPNLWEYNLTITGA